MKNKIDAPKENQCTTRWLLTGFLPKTCSLFSSVTAQYGGRGRWVSRRRQFEQEKVFFSLTKVTVWGVRDNFLAKESLGGENAFAHGLFIMGKFKLMARNAHP